MGRGEKSNKGTGSSGGWGTLVWGDLGGLLEEVT